MFWVNYYKCPNYLTVWTFLLIELLSKYFFSQSASPNYVDKDTVNLNFQILKFGLWVISKVKLMHFMEYVLGWEVTGLQQTPWSYTSNMYQKMPSLTPSLTLLMLFGAGPILGHLTAVQCGGGAADSEETDPATDTAGGGGRKPHPAHRGW